MRAVPLYLREPMRRCGGRSVVCCSCRYSGTIFVEAICVEIQASPAEVLRSGRSVFPVRSLARWRVLAGLRPAGEISETAAGLAGIGLAGTDPAPRLLSFRSLRQESAALRGPFLHRRAR